MDYTIHTLQCGTLLDVYTSGPHTLMFTLTFERFRTVIVYCLCVQFNFKPKHEITKDSVDPFPVPWDAWFLRPTVGAVEKEN